MASAPRKHWAAYVVTAATVVVGVAILVVVAWRTAPRSWQRMAEDEEQELQAARQAIDEAFANVTEEETLPARKRLERAVAESNERLVADDLDLELQTRIAFLKLGIAGPRADRLSAAVAGEPPDKAGLARQLLGEAMQAAANGGSYEFLRVREREGRTTALYRVTSADGGVNYQEWAFVRSVDGQTRIADLYVYAMGEWFSDSIRRLLEIGRVAELGLTQAEREEAGAAVARTAEAAILAKAKNWREFDALVAQFPEGQQKAKTTLVLRTIASRDDPSRKGEAFAQLEAAYPGDVATALLGYGIYAFEGRYAEALAALDQLDETLGGDLYLAADRTEYLVKLGRLDEARAECDRLLDGDDPVGYLVHALVFAAEEEFSDAIEALDRFVRATEAPPGWQVEFAKLEADDEVWGPLFRSEAWRSRFGPP